MDAHYKRAALEDRLHNLEVAYRVLHEACKAAEDKLRDGGVFPINGETWKQLRSARVDCEEFLGIPTANRKV